MRLLFALILTVGSLPAFAASLASSVGLSVYPAGNQPQAQQEQDDYQCYNWAKGQSGFDPMQEREPEAVVSDGPAAGSGAQGALRGAARGALLGEILDDDAGKGAAAGAAIGAMRGRQHSQQQSQQQAAAANSQNQASYAEHESQFKNAMSVCLEGRGYTVR